MVILCARRLCTYASAIVIFWLLDFVVDGFLLRLFGLFDFFLVQFFIECLIYSVFVASVLVVVFADGLLGLTHYHDCCVISVHRIRFDKVFVACCGHGRSACAPPRCACFIMVSCFVHMRIT